MRMRFVGSATLLAGTLLLCSTASAYTRNANPEITSVTCNPGDDTISVVWSKDAGKPAVLGISVFNGVGLLDQSHPKIPGSRGSKGDWTAPASYDLIGGTHSVSVQLYDRTGDYMSSSVTDDC